MPLINCKICNKERYEKPYRIKMGKGIFCSKKCFDIFQIGKTHEERRKGIYINCPICNKRFYIIQSNILKNKFCSRECFSKRKIIVTNKTKEKLRKANLLIGKKPPSQKGKKQSAEHIEKRASKIRGINNHNWKGGITKENEKIRNSIEYKNWRKSVFERDDYTCQDCGKSNENGKRTPLQADHIKPFAYFPELRLDINNGKTLCIDCHKNTRTYLNRWYNK